jgi:hypothetical protein
LAKFGVFGIIRSPLKVQVSTKDAVVG